MLKVDSIAQCVLQDLVFGGCESVHGVKLIFFSLWYNAQFYNKMANITIILLFSLALYYIRAIIIIDDDLIEVFDTLEKMYIFYMYRAYIVHFTVINLLAIL